MYQKELFMKSSRSSKSSQTPQITWAKLDALYNKLSTFGCYYSPAPSKYGTSTNPAPKSMTPEEKQQALSLIKEADTLFAQISAPNKYKLNNYSVSNIMERYGNLKLILKDYAGAEVCFSELITYSDKCKTPTPNSIASHVIYRYRAWAREELGDYTGAQADLERNVNTPPSSYYDAESLAQFCERQGYPHAALHYYAESYRRSMAEGKSWSMECAGESARRCGLLALAINEFDSARDWFQDAINKNCSRTQSAQEGLQKAQAGLRKIEEANNGIASFNLGKDHFNAKRWKAARMSFDDAIKKDPKNGEYLYWRGIVHKAIQDYPAAILDLESAFALGEKLAQPHLTEIKKIQADSAHQQRLEEDRQRRAMEEKEREKQRELENQRRLAQERDCSEHLKRLEEEKRQQENKRNEQKQKEEQKAVDACVQHLENLQLSLKCQPNLSTIDRDFTSLERKIKSIDTKLDTEIKEQFHTLRGNFYYDLSNKEANQIRKQAMLDKALSDFRQILQLNLFAEGIAEKIEEIEKTKNTSSVKQPKLSAEDQQKIEKKKEELRAKLYLANHGLFTSQPPAVTFPSKPMPQPPGRGV